MSMLKFTISALLLSLNIVYGRTKGKGPCDETRECVREKFITGDRMLCYGYYGCKGALMDSDQKAVCSGAKACFRSKFTKQVDAILCNGFAACQKGRDMTNDNKIACNGLRSCYDIVGGLTAPTIMCDGDVTCTNMKPGVPPTLMMNLNAEGAGDQSLLYCNGNGACKETQQRSAGSIYCDGDGACQRSRMQAPNIECQGKRVCKDSTIQPPIGGQLLTLDCAGWFGCANTEIIMAQEIKAYGFNALAQATIETRGVDFNLKAYGFRALAGASIDCKGSTCDIDCRGNACKGVPVLVARSSTLIINPQECDPKDPGYASSKKDPTLPAKVRGIHCPIIKYVTATETEEELKTWRESFVEEWKLSEEYQEMIEMDEIADQQFDQYIAERLRDFEDLQTYDYEDGDNEYFAQQDAMIDMDERSSNYLFGGNIVNDVLQTGKQQISASGLIASNLITALAVFLLTGGLIYCYVQYKYKDALYKQLPQ